MSMANELVAKRYAVALFDLAKENDKLSEIETEVTFVRSLFSETKQLVDFFTHPQIKIEQQKQLLQEHLQAQVSAYVLNTLLLMLDRKRGDSIAVMLDQFLVLAMEEQNAAEAIVYSVQSLSTEEQEEISTMIAKKVGTRTLRLQNIIDPTIIGGLKIQVGNQIFDGTVSGKLERIKRELVV